MKIKKNLPKISTKWFQSRVTSSGNTALTSSHTFIASVNIVIVIMISIVTIINDINIIICSHTFIASCSLDTFSLQLIRSLIEG